jgi:Transcriptional regulator
MRIDDLRLFLEVAKARSMTAASEKLCATPQNVSRIIKQLELELNTSLFKRTKHGVFLTERGKFFYDQVKIMIEKADLINSAFHPDHITGSQNPADALNIMVSYQLSSIVQNYALSISSKYNQIPISIMELDSIDAWEILKKKRPELALLTLNLRFDKEEYQTLASEYNIYFCSSEFLHLFINTSHALANEKLLSLKKIALLPLVIYGGYADKQSLCQKSIEENGITLKIKYRSNRINFCLKYLKENLAACIDIPSLGMNWEAEDKKHITTVPLKERIELTNILFINKDADSQPLCNMFLNMIRRKYNKTFNIL